MQLSLDMLAVVTWWIGSFDCCFGTRICRMSVFPLCFLLWLVPLPEFALNHIVNFLQQGSAYAARLLFVIAGVPVTQDGLRLTTPGLTLEVAEECSSICWSPLWCWPNSCFVPLGAKACDFVGNSSFHCQEWVSNLHAVGACSLCRSKFLTWLATSPGRNSVLPGISGGLVRPTMAASVGRAQADGAAGGHEASNSHCGIESVTRSPPVIVPSFCRKRTRSVKGESHIKPLS